MFFFNDTATTEIYTLSLHDALPICVIPGPRALDPWMGLGVLGEQRDEPVLQVGADVRLDHRHDAAPFGPQRPGFHLQPRDRKSTRLNSSHANISYAVFCLKKQNTLS